MRIQTESERRSRRPLARTASLAGALLLVACADEPPHLAPIHHESMFIQVCTENDWERHIPYLYHAAEIYRRDAACTVVSRVTVLTTDSTPDAPIFQADCGFAAGSIPARKHARKRFTLAEVEKLYSESLVREAEPGIAPIASYAEFHTGQCKDPYAGNIPYLYYVAEIVRRHPDCHRVVDIDVKGRSRYRPRFRATCENKLGTEFSLDYSRSEVRAAYATIYGLAADFWPVHPRFE